MFFPAVSCGQNGSFVVAWNQFRDEDGSETGVFARLFATVGLVTTPVLSWLGLVSVGGALLGVGVGALRRRK